MPIRAATLNVWSLPGPIAKHKPQRMKAIVEHVALLDLQVVAFQEVWTRASRDTLIAGTARIGFAHVWHNPETTGGSGLLVVSKFPITSAHFEPFEARGHPERILHMDYYSGKGFALLEIETEGGLVTLLNTHLHANYARPGKPDEYKGVRAAQVIQLVAALPSIQTPLIAMGDFNLNDDESSYRVLLGLSGLRDVAAALDAKQPTSLDSNPYHRKRHVDKRLDYAFCRDGNRQGLRPVSIQLDFLADLDFDGRPGTYSDHAGLVVEFASGPVTGNELLLEQRVWTEAAELIQEGRQISRQRKKSQHNTAAGALAVGIGTTFQSRKAKQSRRRFLKNTLGVASGLSFAILAEHVGLSQWINPEEMAAYDYAEQQLATLQADRRRH